MVYQSVCVKMGRELSDTQPDEFMAGFGDNETHSPIRSRAKTLEVRLCGRIFASLFCLVQNVR